MIGEAIAADTPRPEGRVLVSHLGAGLADVVFGDAVLRAAAERGIGRTGAIAGSPTELPARLVRWPNVSP